MGDVAFLHECAFRHTAMLKLSCMPIFIPLQRELLRVKFIVMQPSTQSDEDARRSVARAKDILDRDVQVWMSCIRKNDPDGVIAMEWYNKVTYGPPVHDIAVGFCSSLPTLSANVFLACGTEKLRSMMVKLHA